MADMKRTIFREIWDKIEFSPKKFQISEFHQFFFFVVIILIKEGNGVSNMFCKFQDNTMKIFFQNGYLKYFEVATNPPYLRTLTAYPTPVLGGTPGFFFFFFDQNDGKGCKRNYPDAQSRFVLSFGATGNNLLGGLVTTPLKKTRVNYQIRFFWRKKIDT